MNFYLPNSDFLPTQTPKENKSLNIIYWHPAIERPWSITCISADSEVLLKLQWNFKPEVGFPSTEKTKTRISYFQQSKIFNIRSLDFYDHFRKKIIAIWAFLTGLIVLKQGQIMVQIG